MKSSNINNLYIKFLRNNIFFNFTTFYGRLIFKCSCGYISGIKRKNLIWALVYLIKYTKLKSKLLGSGKISLILDGAFNLSRVNLIYEQLLKWGFIIIFVRVLDKLPHNGCRAKVKKSRIKKYRYL
jgi:ribosomal protein S11